MSDTPLRLVGSAQEELSRTLGDMPVPQVVCRSGYHRFAMDDWDPTTPVPRTVTVMHASESRYKFLDPCLKCQEVTRVTYTQPGGLIDGNMASTLIYGEGWQRIPNYLPRGKRLLRAEKVRRGKKHLEDAIGRAVTVTEDRTGDPVTRPYQTRFSGGS